MAARGSGGLPVIDFGNMMAGRIGPVGTGPGGIRPGRLEGDLAARFREARRVVEARRGAGELGFLELPHDRGLAADTLEVAGALRGRFDDVVVVGIGGSALGAVALRDALLGPWWNALDGEARGGAPRLHVLDNPDPDSAAALLDRLDPARTVFNVVSKSGSTAETAALFLVVLERLEEALGAERAGERLVVTTDARRGPLREVVAERGLRSLAVPEAVGGRFSVLSPVGTFPAALCGVGIEAVLGGAAAMAERCAAPRLAVNPAGVLATLLHAADTEMGAGIQVFMPYADRLRGLAYWVQQLWAESLGKAVRTDGLPAETGPTPLPAFGAADQHSVLQLLMEGPRDKVVAFIGRGRPERDLEIPRAFAGKPAFSYLGGHTLHGLLDRERRATAEALRRAGRMNMTITGDRIDARTMGAFFMLFQCAVVYAGALYAVNPLDQPGVEAAKSLARGLLGRKGCDPPGFPGTDPRWRV